MLKKALCAAIVAVIGAVASFTAASPASASDSYHSMNTLNGSGSMSFTEHGDRVWLYDGDPDGRSVWIDVFIGEDDFVYGFAASGYGMENVRQAADGGPFNLPENKTICFDIFLTDNGAYWGSKNHKCWYNDY